MAIKNFAQALSVSALMLFPVAASKALASEPEQRTSHKAVAALHQNLSVDIKRAGKDANGEAREVCTFVMFPNNPEQKVTGLIDNDGAALRFSNGNSVIVQLPGPAVPHGETDSSWQLASGPVTVPLPYVPDSLARVLTRIEFLCHNTLHV